MQSPAPAEGDDQVLAAKLLAQGGDSLAMTLQKLSATLGRQVKLEGDPAEKHRTLALALRDYRVTQTKSAALPRPEQHGYATPSSLRHRHRSRQSPRGYTGRWWLNIVAIVVFVAIGGWFMQLLFTSCQPEKVEPPPIEKFDPNPAHFKP